MEKIIRQHEPMTRGSPSDDDQHPVSAEVQRLRLFSRIAQTVAGDFDLEDLVQSVTDAATQASGGKFGAFFYNQIDDQGEIYSLYTLSGVSRSHFAGFPMPRNTAVFAPTFGGTEVVRSEDIRADPRFGHNSPYFGMPKGHLPVVSYLAVPVISRKGAVHGGLFIAHDQPAVFDEEAEEVVQAIAAHAAIAIDNAALIADARKEAELREVAQHASAKLAAIVESSEDAIVSKSLDGTIMSWNESAQRLFGYTADEVIGRPITLLIPEDRLHEEDEILARIRAGERIEHFETVRRRKDGSPLDVSLSVSPIRDETGNVIGASKIARDIGERVEAQSRQRLLMREMDHRIKNLFALVGGLVAMSARGAESVDQLALALRERLAALAQAHSLTMPLETDESSPSRASLADLLRAILAPYRSSQAIDVVKTGEEVMVEGQMLNSLALLFHEYATNAAKYGALSTSSGMLKIDVQRYGNAVHVAWVEQGGPPIREAPARSGFGNKLEAASLMSLGATVSKSWYADGLSLVLTIPVPPPELSA
ncbi:PAS domain S-box protein [Novosphingobium sp. PhB165]|uniref:PAS domain S-box protein n=1 Tax=Novosphingobium sp. PhB165 TaxID=2485105 RepID=UPI001A9CBB6D|nr:PAS domain S-box protein [Novosphingobium sp. PhB165]